MKICHVITRMIVGGAQENTLLTVRGLQERGHQVTLLTGPTTGPEGRLLDSYSLPGVSIHEEPALIRALAPRQDWRAWRQLRKFFLENKFEVVHTHSSKAGIIGRFAAWNIVPLVIHTIHGQPFNPYQASWRNAVYVRAERAAARRCHHICAVAQAMIEQAVEANIAERKKYSVVYSGMELEPYLNEASTAGRILRKKLGIPADSPVIGKVARLFELKGHQFLIEAAPAIVNEFPEVRFLLVGDGILREQLETRVKSMGLENNFIFTGLVPPSEIPAYMGTIDVLAHFSLREGLPRTVVQGLAAGKPAVAFALDGTPEVVLHGKTGFLASPEEPGSVRDGLLKLLREPKLARQLGETGQRMVEKRFSWQEMVEKLESLYLDLKGQLASDWR